MFYSQVSNQFPIKIFPIFHNKKRENIKEVLIKIAISITMYCNTSTLTISIRVLNKMRREKKPISTIYLSRKYAFFLITVSIFVILLMDCVIIDNIKL